MSSIAAIWQNIGSARKVSVLPSNSLRWQTEKPHMPNMNETLLETIGTTRYFMMLRHCAHQLLT